MADPQGDKPQLDKFKDLARQLEADESEERFEDQVRKVAKPAVPRRDKKSD